MNVIYTCDSPAHDAVRSRNPVTSEELPEDAPPPNGWTERWSPAHERTRQFCPGCSFGKKGKP